MKAIMKKHPKRGVDFVDVPMPKMGADDLLIKIEKTSICGTDVHLYLWDEWASKTLPVPSIIGHEFFGRVAKVGKNVTGFSVGDRVAGESHITCGRCYQCRTGNRVACPNTINIGVDRDGAFAEYFCHPATNLVKLPDEVDDDIASILDPLGNAAHTALSYDLVGKDVLITGAGPIGLMSIPLVKMAGARHVVITDINEKRLKMAREMGATAAVNVSKGSLEKKMIALGMQEGFEVGLEMSGSPKALQDQAQYVSHGGKIVLLGILPSDAHIDWHLVVFKMLTIKGIYGREIFNTWYQVIALIQKGLDVSPVITHRLPVTDYEVGFEAMLSGNCGKVVLDWTVL